MGASDAASAVYYDAARELGDFIVKQNLTLVYGGGERGMMGEIARNVNAKGGRVVGVIPKLLVDKEVANTDCEELHIVESMHDRKMLMSNLSDAVLCFPGGMGTLDEMCEIITWNQLDIIRKPCGFWNVNGYFSPVFDFLKHMNNEGFIHQDHLDLFSVSDTLPELYESFLHMDLSPVRKWGK